MKIIKLTDFKGEDPILRKGDLVRLLEDYNPEEIELIEQCAGYCGFVTEVKQRYGEDSEAPGQAINFTIAFPFEDGWVEISDIPIFAIRRILNKDLKIQEEAYGNE